MMSRKQTADWRAGSSLGQSVTQPATEECEMEEVLPRQGVEVTSGIGASGHEWRPERDDMELEANLEGWRWLSSFPTVPTMPAVRYQQHNKHSVEAEQGDATTFVAMAVEEDDMGQTKKNDDGILKAEKQSPLLPPVPAGKAERISPAGHSGMQVRKSTDNRRRQAAVNVIGGTARIQKTSAKGMRKSQGKIGRVSQVGHRDGWQARSGGSASMEVDGNMEAGFEEKVVQLGGPATAIAGCRQQSGTDIEMVREDAEVHEVMEGPLPAGSTKQHNGAGVRTGQIRKSTGGVRKREAAKMKNVPALLQEIGGAHKGGRESRGKAPERVARSGHRGGRNKSPSDKAGMTIDGNTGVELRQEVMQLNGPAAAGAECRQQSAPDAAASVECRRQYAPDTPGIEHEPVQTGGHLAGGSPAKTRTASSRRPRRTQQAAAQTLSCDARRALGILCQDCECGGSVLSHGVTKCEVVLDGLHEEGQGLRATKDLQPQEIITVFGGAVVLRHGLKDEMVQLMQNPVHCRMQKRFQYSFEYHYDQPHNKCMVVPEQDRQLALSCAITPALRKVLQRPPMLMGCGQFAQHVCCPQHRNAELVLVLCDEDSEELALAVRALKPIPTGERIGVSYTASGSADAWSDIFTCTCCQCSGRCGPSRLSLEDFIQHVWATHLLQRTDDRLMDNVVHPGIRVQVSDGPEEKWEGEVVDTTTEMATVCAWNSTTQSEKTVRVEKWKCDPVQDELSWPAVTSRTGITREHLRHVLPSPTGRGSDDWLGTEIIRNALRWCMHGHTGTYGLTPPDSASIQVHSPDVWQKLEAIDKECNGDVDQVCATIARTRMLTKRAPMPSLKFVILPVGLPLHWVGTCINITNGRLWVDDSLRRVTGDRHGYIAKLIWLWLFTTWRGQQKPTWHISWQQMDRHVLHDTPGISETEERRIWTSWQSRGAASGNLQQLVSTETQQLWKRVGICVTTGEVDTPMDLHGEGWPWRDPGTVQEDIPQQDNDSECGMYTVLAPVFRTRGWSLRTLTPVFVRKARHWLLKIFLEQGQWMRQKHCPKCNTVFDVTTGELAAARTNRPTCADSEACRQRVRNLRQRVRSRETQQALEAGDIMIDDTELTQGCAVPKKSDWDSRVSLGEARKCPIATTKTSPSKRRKGSDPSSCKAPARGATQRSKSESKPSGQWAGKVGWRQSMLTSMDKPLEGQTRGTDTHYGAARRCAAEAEAPDTEYSPVDTTFHGDSVALCKEDAGERDDFVAVPVRASTNEAPSAGITSSRTLSATADNSQSAEADSPAGVTRRPFTATEASGTLPKHPMREEKCHGSGGLKVSPQITCQKQVKQHVKGPSRRAKKWTWPLRIRRLEDEVAERREALLQIAARWSFQDAAQARANSQAAAREEQREIQQARRLSELLQWFGDHELSDVEEARNALKEGKEWVREQLNPWTSKWIKAHKESRWTELKSERVVVATFEHWLVQSKDEAVIALQRAGIRCDSQEDWNNIVWQEHRRSNLSRTTVTVRVTVLNNKALCDLFLGVTQVQGADGPALCQIDKLNHHPQWRKQAVLQPANDRSRARMQKWRQIWRLLGASEEQVRCVIQLASETTVDSWQTDQVRLWSPDGVRSLDTIWGDARHREARGQIRLGGKTNSASEREYQVLSNRWAVTGRQAFENRKPGTKVGLIAIPDLPQMAVPIGIPFQRKLQQWQANCDRLIEHADTSTANAEQVFSSAPYWLKRPCIQTKWEPLLEHSEQEFWSSVCIRFCQVRRARISRVQHERTPVLDILELLNLIQSKCRPMTRAFQVEDVDFVGFYNDEGMLEGMLSIQVRRDVSLEDDQLVGAYAALFFGNMIQTGPGAHMKWCPVRRKFGSTACVVTSVSVAKHTRGSERCQLRLGVATKTGKGRLLTQHDPTIRKMIKHLSTQEPVGHLLSRLKATRHKRRRPITIDSPHALSECKDMDVEIDVMDAEIQSVGDQSVEMSVLGPEATTELPTSSSTEWQGSATNGEDPLSAYMNVWGHGQGLRHIAREILYGMGDWEGARAMFGRWVPRVRGHWHGACATRDLWAAEKEGTLENYLDKLRSCGHVHLANEGRRLLQHSVNGSTIGMKGSWDRHKWIGMLEASQHMLFRTGKCPVYTWNLGNVGYELIRHEIQNTLEKGAAIVLFQEFRFPKGAQRRVMAEMKQIHPEYACFLESGPDVSGDDRESEECAWTSRRNMAVITFLHKRVFDCEKSRRKEWFVGDLRQRLAHMSRGRVGWVEAVTLQGQAVTVVNIHQATSRHADLQQKVWTTLQARIGQRMGGMCILGGDMNAGPDGHRVGYAPSTTPLMQRVDEQLRTFVQMTGGTLVSTDAPSRVEVATGRLAKLDHVITWELQLQAPTGIAEWPGGTDQDHARAGFWVGTEIFGDAIRSRDGKRKQIPRIRRKQIEAIQDLLNAHQKPQAQEALKAVMNGTLDAGIAMADIFRSRRDKCQELVDQLRVKSSGRERTRGRHLSATQRQLRREMAVFQLARSNKKSLNTLSQAKQHCIQISGLDRDIPQNDLPHITETTAWKRFVDGNVELRQQKLAESIRRQTEESRRRLDRQARWRFCTEHRGPGKFKGKYGPPPEQQQLRWMCPIGVQWLERRHVRGSSQADDCAPLEWTGIPGVEHTQLSNGELLTVTINRKPAQEEAAMESIRSLAATWRDILKRTEAQAQAGLEQKDEPNLELHELWSKVFRDDDMDTPVNARQIWDSVQWQVNQGMMDIISKAWCTRTGWKWAQNSREGRGTLLAWAHLLRTRTLATDMQDAGFELQVRDWSQRAEGSSGDMVLHSVTVSDLCQVETLLRNSTDWESSRVEEKIILYSDGPWQDDNKIVAWEQYFESQGYSPHARCPNASCAAEAPSIMTRGPSQIRPPPTERPDQAGDSREPSAAGAPPGHRPWDNACKLRQGLPLDTVTQQHRELVSFCQQCWRFTNFRENKDVTAKMEFMYKAGVFNHRLIPATAGRLRGELNDSEWRAFIDNFLKSDKACGPDGVVNDLIKTATDAELKLIRVWGNQILVTGDVPPRQVTEMEMQGLISLLHKGGATTDKPSDWRPVVLLNGVNQLIGYVINSRLTRLVEQAGLLEPGQGGCRKSRRTHINQQKLSWITEEAQRQGRQVLRVDIDFRNAYNSMNQAALWAVMRAFQIPDVDLLEKLYQTTTVKMAGDHNAATITFDTGVAQGSVLSPMLFIIFLNALLRLLTVRGQNNCLCHGLADTDQFNNLAFCDDMSILASGSEDMQTLLDTVHEFETWSGIQVNLKKTILLPIASDQQLITLRYRGQQIRQAPATEPVRYLGFYATANGDLQATKKRVLERGRVAKESIRQHPLEPEEAVDTFVSEGVGIFRYSAALCRWTEKELMQLQRVWVQAYKLAWHLPEQTANAIFTFPQDCAGLQYPTPLGVLAQELQSHLQRSLMHEDVARQITIRELEQAKTQWACTSFADMRQEMELWSWDQANSNPWARMAKCYQLLNMDIELPLEEDNANGRRVGWAAATRPLRRLKQRIDRVGGRYAAWDTHDWDIDEKQWELLWTGEKAFWRGVKLLVAAGYTDVCKLGIESGARCQVPKLVRVAESSGRQQIRVMIPRDIPGLDKKTRDTMQAYLEMVDWQGLGVVARDHQPQHNIKWFLRMTAPDDLPGDHSYASTFLRWLKARRPDVRNEMACHRAGIATSTHDLLRTVHRDEVGMDQITTAVHNIRGWKQPDQVVCGALRWLHEESASNSLPSAPDDVKRVWHQLCQQMDPKWTNRYKCQLTRISCGWEAADWPRVLREELQQFESRCTVCMTRDQMTCTHCNSMRCSTCACKDRGCPVCGEVAPMHALHTTDEQWIDQPGRNIHNMGNQFVHTVVEARRRVGHDASIDHVGQKFEFKCQIGCWATEGAQGRLRHLQALPAERMMRELVNMKQRDVLLLPAEWWPDTPPEFDEMGWWYIAHYQTSARKCPACGERRLKDMFNKSEWKTTGSICNTCLGQGSAYEGRGRTKRKKLSADSVVVFRTADPRYAGRGDDISGGDIALTADDILQLLDFNITQCHQPRYAWLTTNQMGFALVPEDNEVHSRKDLLEGRPTARMLAPMASAYIREREAQDVQWSDSERMLLDELILLDQEWGPDTTTPPLTMSESPSMQWEAASTPHAANEPSFVPSSASEGTLGEDWLLDAIPVEATRGKIDVHVKSLQWTESVANIDIVSTEGLTTCTTLDNHWTITSGMWHFLKAQWPGRKAEVCATVHAETQVQEQLEATGYRSTTWGILWHLRALRGARVLEGETMVTAPPFFESAGRGECTFWSRGSGPRVIIWDSLSPTEKSVCLQELQNETDWVVWCKMGDDMWENRPSTVGGVEIFNSKRLEDKLRKTNSASQDNDANLTGEEPVLRGKGCKWRNWWKEGRVERTQGRHHMTCWTHRPEGKDPTHPRCIQELEREWLRPGAKDSMSFQAHGLDWDYWLGTEAGLLGCHGFRGLYAGGDGSESKGDMGAGCCIWGHENTELGLEWRLIGPCRPVVGRELTNDGLSQALSHTNTLTGAEWEALNIHDLQSTDYVCVRGLFFQPVGFSGLRSSVKVGRSIEGATSNRAELAAMAEALTQADVQKDLLYLCDSEAVLKTINQWVGEGGKRVFTEYPDADILKTVVTSLHARARANSYTVFVKVRAHRGEYLNEMADSLAEEGRGAETSIWNERTERFVFSCDSPAHKIRSRTWSAGIRNTVREQAAQVCVQAALKSSAVEWKKEHIDGSRRREEICADVCAQVEKSFAMGEEDWNEECMAQRRLAEVGQPASSTWTVDFLTRRGESRECMGKWLRNKGVSWKARRRLLQANSNSFPCGTVLHRWKKRPNSACEICQQLKGPSGGATEPESLGHIQSAYCLGQVDTARAAHNRCFEQLQHDLNKFKAENSTMEFITLEAEQSFKTLWEKHAFTEVCSFDAFSEEVALFERQRPASSEERADMVENLRAKGVDQPEKWQTRCSICGECMSRDDGKVACGLPCHTACWLRHRDESNPVGARFWTRVKTNVDKISRKRIDGVAVDRRKKRIFLLEFKRTSDATDDYRCLTEKRATAQYESITSGLQLAATQNGWEVTQLNFVAGNRSVNVEKWEENFKKLKIPKACWKQIRRRLVMTLLQEHENLFQSYWANRYGWGATGKARETQGCLEHVVNL